MLGWNTTFDFGSNSDCDSRESDCGDLAFVDATEQTFPELLLSLKEKCFVDAQFSDHHETKTLRVNEEFISSSLRSQHSPANVAHW